jgi:hypothetical protein
MVVFLMIYWKDNLASEVLVHFTAKSNEKVLVPAEAGHVYMRVDDQVFESTYLVDVMVLCIRVFVSVRGVHGDGFRIVAIVFEEQL